MANATNVKIVFTGDATQLTRTLKDVGASSDGLGGKLGGLMGNVGKLAGAFAGMAVAREVGQFLSESAKAAMDDAKAKEILHTAIRNVTGSTDDELAALDAYIEKTQAATGYTEEQLRPAMVKLTTATGDVQKAQELMAIAMDTATARGASLDTVIAALEKAQNGNLGSLQRLGIATKDASGQTLSYDQILQNLAKTYQGSTAAAADTMAGKLERTKLIFGEMKETLGAALLPIIEKFASFIMERMPLVEQVFGFVGQAIGAIMPIVDDLFKLVDEVLKGIEDLWREYGDEIMAVVGPLWEGIKGIIETAINLIKDIIKTVIAIITGDWDTAWNGIKDIVSGIWDLIKSIVQTAMDTIKNIVTGVLDVLKDLWSEAWGVLKDVASDIWTDISGFFSDIGTDISDFFKSIPGWITDALSTVWDVFVGPFKAAWEWIQTYIIGPFHTAINEIKSWFGSATDEQVAAVSSVVGSGKVRRVQNKAHGGLITADGGSFTPLTSVGAVPIIAHEGEYVLTKGDTALMRELISAVKETRGGSSMTFNVSGTGGLDLGRQIAGILATV